MTVSAGLPWNFHRFLSPTDLVPFWLHWIPIKTLYLINHPNNFILVRQIRSSPQPHLCHTSTKPLPAQLRSSQKSSYVTRLTHLEVMRYLPSISQLLYLLNLLVQCNTISIESSDTECPRPGSCPTLNPDAAPMDMARWMSHLKDGTCLTTLSIPGTHDTMAFQKIKTFADQFANTQSGNLRQQLDAGVRFIDIRARHYRNAFEMHHGAVYLGHNFTSVVQMLEGFLSGPGKDEVVVMRLKDEGYKPKHNKRTFAETLENYVFEHPDTSEILQRILHMPLRNQVSYKFPRVGPETRGKVVMIQDYNTKSASNTFGANFKDSEKIKLQDYYNVTTTTDIVQKKWNKIIQFWVHHIPEQIRRAEAGDDCQNLPLLINFLSAGSPFQTPAMVALHYKRGINNRVQQLLREKWQTVWDAAFTSFQWEIPELRGPTTGIVVWDFINTKAARLIVSFNFRGDRRFDWGEVGYARPDDTWSYKPWN